MARRRRGDPLTRLPLALLGLALAYALTATLTVGCRSEPREAPRSKDTPSRVNPIDPPSVSGQDPPPVKLHRTPEVPEPNPLFVPPDAYDFSQNPKLRARVSGSAHGYFRFVNIPFAETVCERFASVLPEMPAVNLHGDAHLEQYAITDRGRGLTDFDDSTTGPGVIDLVRFGVSVHLTCQAKGWESKAGVVVDEFLKGYLEALEDPEREVSLPALVRRVKGGFRSDRSAFLAWTEKLMEPPEVAQETFDKAVGLYQDTMRTLLPDLPPTFFEIKRVGRIHIGVGSALDLKYLIRIEGPTEAADDDEILEAKQVRDLSRISCIQGARKDDPFRILVAQSRISYEPYRYPGYMHLEGRTFWIHEWAANYSELDVVESLATPDDLIEVAYDVGFQLGRGHPRQIATPLDAQLRRAQLLVVKRNKEKIEAVIAELAEKTDAAWRRFVTFL